MVSTLLFPSEDHSKTTESKMSDLRYELAMAVRALLSASTTQAKVSITTSNRKKGLYLYTRLPRHLKHEQAVFQKRTKNLSNLMYRIKR